MAAPSNALRVISDEFELIVGKLGTLLKLYADDPKAIQRLRTAQERAPGRNWPETSFPETRSGRPYRSDGPALGVNATAGPETRLGFAEPGGVSGSHYRAAYLVGKVEFIIDPGWR
jgi:hypothetical protein